MSAVTQRRRRASLLGKALRIGLATAFGALLFVDGAFLFMQSTHQWRQWGSMHDRVLDDWVAVCRHELPSGRLDDLQVAARRVTAGPLAVDYAYLADPDGRILAHSDPSAAGSTLERWSASLKGQRSLERRAAIELPGGRRGWAVIGYPAASDANVGEIVRKQRLEMMPPVIAASLLMLLLVGAISILVARTIIRPVESLAHAARRIAGGDLSAQVEESGDDELAALQADFNTMARRLRELDELKAQFLAKITHDLRTPLSGIRGHAELLRMELKGPLKQAQQDSVTAIVRSTDSLAGLVNNILDMTTIEAGRMIYRKQDVDVAELLSSVAALMRGQAEQYEVALTVRLDEELPRVKADPEALRRVITNLVSNALKFTPKGGEVTLAARRDGSGVRVSVSDTGIGIPPDKRAALFSKFAQIHESKQLPRSAPSTGLGLAICKELVEAHGGRIAVESEPGRSTTFFFTLPA